MWLTTLRGTLYGNKCTRFNLQWSIYGLTHFFNWKYKKIKAENNLFRFTFYFQEWSFYFFMNKNINISKIKQQSEKDEVWIYWVVIWWKLSTKLVGVCHASESVSTRYLLCDSKNWKENFWLFLILQVWQDFVCFPNTVWRIFPR